METIKVKQIFKNSTIGVFTPSEPIISQRIDRFNNGIQILKSLGFDTIIANNALKHSNFTAGTIDDRISDIDELLNNPKVDLLFASWGGKSCNQLINYLDYKLIKKKKKAFLGFSDTGVLLNHITARTGLITFYGPNVIGKLDETEHYNLDILKSTEYTKNLLGNTQKVSCKTLHNGTAHGKLIGGNLSTFVLGVVCSNIPKTYYEDSILFWEDGGNPAQLINQYLTAIENKGIFDKINGMIIGDFITKDNLDWKQVDDFESILDKFSKYNFPILYSPTFGHKNLENPIMPIGAKCTLDADKYSLVLTENILL